MRRLFLALAIVLVPLTAEAQSETYQKIGWWEIVYFPGAGACSALAEFENGVYFLIGLDTTSGDLSLAVAILNQSWGSIVPGDEYEVTATFGRKGPWYLTMYGTKADELFGLEATWAADSDSAGRFVEEFMASVNMKWAYQGTVLGDFSLKDSRKAFNATLECTEVHLGSGDAGGGKDPFSGSKQDPFQ